MKLFTVTIETEVVVIAEDKEEAEHEAARVALNEDFECRATPMSHYPAGWHEDSIPFGDGDPEDPDRRVVQWITLGAAEELQALQAKLRKQKGKNKP